MEKKKKKKKKKKKMEIKQTAQSQNFCELLVFT